jgi:5'-deoxynucleotidase
VNNYKDLLRVRRAGDVKRWHTKRTNREQTLAAHQWGVAMLVQWVDPFCRKELIMAALTHDNTELDTGDIPTPAKWKSQAFADALTAVEQKSLLCEIWPDCLTQDEHNLLKWADSVELLLYAQEEVNMGNLYFGQTVQVVLDRVADYAATERWPKAKIFIEEFTKHQGDLSYDYESK